VQAKLVHAISEEPVEGWKSVQDLKRSNTAEIGDYVLCDDWVGQVFDESIVQVTSGQLVRLPEISSRLTVGDKGNDILPPAMGVSNMLSYIMGNNRPSSVDTVVNVTHTVLAVCWLAINQAVSLELSFGLPLCLISALLTEDRKRPERFWHEDSLSRLTLFKTRSDQDMRVGFKVYLKDDVGIPVTRHGQEGEPAGTVVVNALMVKETRTTVNVLWQDGTQETLPSTVLIPYMNPDEYDCWPGDHVLWKSEDQTRAVTIQHVDAGERIASIRHTDTGTIELISVLELDAHGASEWAAALPHAHLSVLGIRRGDFVFIHPEGQTNGLPLPAVPKIGEVEAWVREAPMTTDGQQLAGWRREMAQIGTDIATKRGGDALVEDKVKRPCKGEITFSWCGEVTGLRLDGSIEVTHPNSDVSVYSLSRLTKLYDGIEQLEDDGWADDMSEDGESNPDEASEGVWLKDEAGVWRYHLHEEGDEDEWEETDEEYIEDETGMAMNLDEDGTADDANMVTDLRPTTPPPLLDTASHANTVVRTHRAEDAQDIMANGDTDDDDPTDSADDSPWKRFDILASAPHDHAYYSSPPAQPSKQFLGRLAKEYRVLSTSLPDTIIVRAFEDRTDLLRSVIIGPDNTPYQDAPFVIDWMLDSNFPHSPPIAHFLSWTNGNGRDSALTTGFFRSNMYENGKVCLSILNTWSGDKSESWGAARSSLLQAFVSIQGLVLVKEPWFCEPAYEKLRGTEEGIVNRHAYFPLSRLYNEKAYCLSRGFVRRALEIPPGGLESDLKWLYFKNNKLEKVLKDSRALIATSRAPANGNEASDLAVPRLTSGGIITLERTLVRLQALLDSTIHT
ncbi:hypothetical protein FIBSPDRAFT_748048, partial [Athelia psychrophila]